MSKAIIFNLDETLRNLGTSINMDNSFEVILRPKLIDLLKKLSNVKKNGIDSIIFTSASMLSVEKYFLEKLPKKYQNVFSRIITRESYLESEQGTMENNLYKLEVNKIVKSLDYNEILFFDGNISEYQYLKELYDEKLDCKFPVPDKSVTLVSLLFWPRCEVEMYALKELAKNVDKSGKSYFTQKINNYFELMTNEPGCKIMMEMIDEFVSKENPKGFTYVNEIEEMVDFNRKVIKSYNEIDNIIDRNSSLADKYRDYEDEYYARLQVVDAKELL